MRVQFRALGPLELLDGDGKVVDLGRPKQRAVLAMLLVNANRVVSIDRFAEALWPGEAGDPGSRSVPVYISNLRRLIEPDRPPRSQPQVLLTRAPGYVLCVGTEDYDAARFEELVAEGRKQLASDRPRSARRALGQALGLWRGAAFEEFADPFAELEATRLGELRTAALQDRLVADLALGAHGEVVGELEALVKEHPLREQLWGLLMLALYRSGRQAEALRAYAGVRRLMATELGLQPGPQLRDLEAAVLAQSPALDWRPPEPEPDEAMAGASAPAQAPPVEEGLVGREPELAAFDEALGHLRTGAGAVVLVSGEPGIGKTRLAEETVARAAEQGVTVAWGRSDEGEGAPAFWPWIQVVRALLSGVDDEVLRDALHPVAAELAQVVPEVTDLVGAVPPPPVVDGAEARFRFYTAMQAFLERLGRRRPVLVVLDDLHWADQLSLRLTEHLATTLAGAPVLLLLLYRDVDPAPNDDLIETLGRLARHPRRHELPLTGLREVEVGQVMARAAASEPPPAAVTAVWSRTDGNPFFVGELTRLLVADKALEDVSAVRSALPGAVRQVIRQRVARLPEETRRLLSVAAVAGHDFHLDVVAAVAGVDADHALDLVDLAIARGVVAEEQSTVGRFRFSHSLVQETIYREMSGPRRARLHGRVGQALDRGIAGRALPSELAHHFYEAVPVLGPEPAIDGAMRASDAALAAFAYEAAEDHLRRALALVDAMAPGEARDRNELVAQNRLAAVLTLVKGVAVADTADAWQRAAELSSELEDRMAQVQSQWGSFSFAWASGDLDGAAALGREILELGRAFPPSAVTVTGLLAVGSIAMCRGDLDDAHARLSEARVLAERLAPGTLAEVTFADVRVQVDSWLATAVQLQGDSPEAQRLVQGLLERARSAGDPFTVAIGLAFGAFVGVLAHAPETREVAEELLAHAESHQLADFAFHASVVRAWTSPAGVATAVEGTAGIRPWRPFWSGLQAETCLRAGNHAEAGAHLDAAFAEAAAMGGSFCLAELHRLRGELLADADPSEAEAAFRRAIAVAERQGAALYRDRAAGSLARVR